MITEFYGKERAKFCIKFAIITNVIVAVIIIFMDHLPATNWSKINNETFHQVFGYYGVAFSASLVACYISQALDVRLYLGIRKLTKGKYLWLRSNGSTCVSLLIDTTTVIGIMTLFGIFSSEHMWSLIVNSYSWKLFFTISSTPLFYLGVTSIKYFINPASIIETRSTSAVDE